MKKQISEMEKAYFAGLFDGEGCVRINNNTHGYNLTVSLSITYVPILEIMRSAFGGSISIKTKKRPEHKQLYSWQIGGREAHNFIMSIHPYLHEKRPQTE